MDKYILALDQGTSSSRAIVFDHSGNTVAQKEFTQYFPKPGWVEHDPMEIFSSQAGVAVEAISALGLTGAEIAAIGITNQRETTIVWDAESGEPVHNAIVWQDRRTAPCLPPSLGLRKWPVSGPCLHLKWNKKPEDRNVQDR